MNDALDLDSTCTHGAVAPSTVVSVQVKRREKACTEHTGKGRRWEIRCSVLTESKQKRGGRVSESSESEKMWRGESSECG